MTIKLKHLIRSIVWVVLLCFGSEQILYAAPSTQAQTKAPVYASTQKILSDPHTLLIPTEYASVKEVYRGKGDRLIIHFQDAHSNLSGQKNLAGALDQLMEHYGIPLVLVEGSAEEATLDDVRKTSPLRDWKITASKLLFEGIISGEEYLNLTTEQPMKLMGIENRQLYEENLRTYAQLLQERRDIQQYLRISRIALDILKNKFYPKNILSLEKEKNNKDNFKRHFSLLLTLADDAKIILQGEYPESFKLKQLVRTENQIDFSKANEELQSLILTMEKTLSPSERKLLKANLHSKKSKTQKESFFQNILTLAQSHRVRLNNHPTLQMYQSYLHDFDDIQMSGLFGELSALEDEIYWRLVSTDDARKIRAIDRYLDLVSKAYRLELNSDEFRLLIQNESDFLTSSWQAFINEKLTELKTYDAIIPYKTLLDDRRADLKNFYSLVHQRDVAFVANARQVMDKENQNVAFLIAGGYHTDHLTELLREEDVSYIVLTPHVAFETNREQYESILLSSLSQRAALISQAETIRKTAGRFTAAFLITREKNSTLQMPPEAMRILHQAANKYALAGTRVRTAAIEPALNDVDPFATNADALGLKESGGELVKPVQPRTMESVPELKEFRAFIDGKAPKTNNEEFGAELRDRMKKEKRRRILRRSLWIAAALIVIAVFSPFFPSLWPRIETAIANVPAPEAEVITDDSIIPPPKLLADEAEDVEEPQSQEAESSEPPVQEPEAQRPQLSDAEIEAQETQRAAQFRQSVMTGVLFGRNIGPTLPPYKQPEAVQRIIVPTKIEKKEPPKVEAEKDRFQADVNTPDWLKFNPAPTLTNAKDATALQARWLKVNDWPHMDPVNRYLQNLRLNGQTGNDRNMPSATHAKVMLAGALNATLTIHPQNFSDVLKASKLTQSESAFAAFEVSVLVREAAGTDFVEHSKGLGRLDPNNITPRDEVANSLTAEFYEIQKQLEFLNWASENGHFSIEALEKSILRITNDPKLTSNESQFLVLMATHLYRQTASLYPYRNNPRDLFNVEMSHIIEMYLKSIRASVARSGGQRIIYSSGSVKEWHDYHKTQNSDRAIRLLNGSLQPNPENLLPLLDDIWPRVQWMMEQSEKEMAAFRESGTRASVPSLFEEGTAAQRRAFLEELISNGEILTVKSAAERIQKRFPALRLNDLNGAVRRDLNYIRDENVPGGNKNKDRYQDNYIGSDIAWVRDDRGRKPLIFFNPKRPGLKTLARNKAPPEKFLKAIKKITARPQKAASKQDKVKEVEVELRELIARADALEILYPAVLEWEFQAAFAKVEALRLKRDKDRIYKWAQAARDRVVKKVQELNDRHPELTDLLHHHKSFMDNLPPDVLDEVETDEITSGIQKITQVVLSSREATEEDFEPLPYAVTEILKDLEFKDGDIVNGVKDGLLKYLNLTDKVRDQTLHKRAIAQQADADVLEKLSRKRAGWVKRSLLVVMFLTAVVLGTVAVMLYGPLKGVLFQDETANQVAATKTVQDVDEASKTLPPPDDEPEPKAEEKPQPKEPEKPVDPIEAAKKLLTQRLLAMGVHPDELNGKSVEDLEVVVQAAEILHEAAMRRATAAGIDPEALEGKTTEQVMAMAMQAENERRQAMARAIRAGLSPRALANETTQTILQYAIQAEETKKAEQREKLKGMLDKVTATQKKVDGLKKTVENQANQVEKKKKALEEAKAQAKKLKVTQSQIDQMTDKVASEYRYVNKNWGADPKRHQYTKSQVDNAYRGANNYIIWNNTLAKKEAELKTMQDRLNNTDGDKLISQTQKALEEAEAEQAKLQQQIKAEQEKLNQQTSAAESFYLSIEADPRATEAFDPAAEPLSDETLATVRQYLRDEGNTARPPAIGGGLRRTGPGQLADDDQAPDVPGAGVTPHWRLAPLDTGGFALVPINEVPEQANTGFLVTYPSGLSTLFMNEETAKAAMQDHLNSQNRPIRGVFTNPKPGVYKWEQTTDPQRFNKGIALILADGTVEEFRGSGKPIVHGGKLIWDHGDPKLADRRMEELTQEYQKKYGEPGKWEQTGTGVMKWVSSNIRLTRPDGRMEYWGPQYAPDAMRRYEAREEPGSGTFKEVSPGEFKWVPTSKLATTNAIKLFYPNRNEPVVHNSQNDAQFMMDQFAEGRQTGRWRLSSRGVYVWDNRPTNIILNYPEGRRPEIFKNEFDARQARNQFDARAGKTAGEWEETRAGSDIFIWQDPTRPRILGVDTIVIQPGGAAPITQVFAVTEEKAQRNLEASGRWGFTLTAPQPPLGPNLQNERLAQAQHALPDAFLLKEAKAHSDAADRSRARMKNIEVALRRDLHPGPTPRLPKNIDQLFALLERGDLPPWLEQRVLARVDRIIRDGDRGFGIFYYKRLLKILAKRTEEVIEEAQNLAVDTEEWLGYETFPKYRIDRAEPNITPHDNEHHAGFVPIIPAEYVLQIPLDLTPHPTQEPQLSDADKALQNKAQNQWGAKINGAAKGYADTTVAPKDKPQVQPAADAAFDAALKQARITVKNLKDSNLDGDKSNAEEFLQASSYLAHLEALTDPENRLHVYWANAPPATAPRLNELQTQLATNDLHLQRVTSFALLESPDGTLAPMEYYNYDKIQKPWSQQTDQEKANINPELQKVMEANPDAFYITQVEENGTTVHYQIHFGLNGLHRYMNDAMLDARERNMRERIAPAIHEDFPFLAHLSSRYTELQAQHRYHQQQNHELVRQIRIVQIELHLADSFGLNRDAYVTDIPVEAPFVEDLSHLTEWQQRDLERKQSRLNIMREDLDRLERMAELYRVTLASHNIDDTNFDIHGPRHQYAALMGPDKTPVHYFSDPRDLLTHAQKFFPQAAEAFYQLESNEHGFEIDLGNGFKIKKVATAAIVDTETFETKALLDGVNFPSELTGEYYPDPLLRTHPPTPELQYDNLPAYAAKVPISLDQFKLYEQALKTEAGQKSYPTVKIIQEGPTGSYFAWHYGANLDELNVASLHPLMPDEAGNIDINGMTFHIDGDHQIVFGENAAKTHRYSEEFRQSASDKIHGVATDLKKPGQPGHDTLTGIKKGLKKSQSQATYAKRLASSDVLNQAAIYPDRNLINESQIPNPGKLRENLYRGFIKILRREGTLAPRHDYQTFFAQHPVNHQVVLDAQELQRAVWEGGAVVPSEKDPNALVLKAGQEAIDRFDEEVDRTRAAIPGLQQQARDDLKNRQKHVRKAHRLATNLAENTAIDPDKDTISAIRWWGANELKQQVQVLEQVIEEIKTKPKEVAKKKAKTKVAGTRNPKLLRHLKLPGPMQNISSLDTDISKILGENLPQLKSINGGRFSLVGNPKTREHLMVLVLASSITMQALKGSKTIQAKKTRSRTDLSRSRRAKEQSVFLDLYLSAKNKVLRGGKVGAMVIDLRGLTTQSQKQTTEFSGYLDQLDNLAELQANLKGWIVILAPVGLIGPARKRLGSRKNVLYDLNQLDPNMPVFYLLPLADTQPGQALKTNASVVFYRNIQGGRYINLLLHWNMGTHLNLAKADWNPESGQRLQIDRRLVQIAATRTGKSLAQTQNYLEQTAAVSIITPSLLDQALIHALPLIEQLWDDFRGLMKNLYNIVRWA